MLMAGRGGCAKGGTDLERGGRHRHRGCFAPPVCFLRSLGAVEVDWGRFRGEESCGPLDLWLMGSGHDQVNYRYPDSQRMEKQTLRFLVLVMGLLTIPSLPPCSIWSSRSLSCRSTPLDDPPPETPIRPDCNGWEPNFGELITSRNDGGNEGGFKRAIGEVGRERTLCDICGETIIEEAECVEEADCVRPSRASPDPQSPFEGGVEGRAVEVDEKVEELEAEAGRPKVKAEEDGAEARGEVGRCPSSESL